MKSSKHFSGAVAGFMMATCVTAAGSSSPTFHRDIEPILQKRCQSCHRAGEIGPMPLVTYTQVRPWAKAIREAVLRGQMPPWFANPKYGHFANDPSVTQSEKQIISQWAAEVSPEGSPSDAPPAKNWPDGWNIGTPDVVLSMPKPFPIPAKAVVDYQYVILPTHFSKDVWVKAVEVRPSDRSVVHHAVLYVREPGDKWLKGVPAGIMYGPPASNVELLRETRETKADILAVYTPGAAGTLLPAGMAKKIPAGSDLVLQLHYTSKDQSTSDQTRIGLITTTRPERRVLTLQMGNDRFVIPPGDRDYQVRVSGTMPGDALLLSLFPHMHLRGSEFEYHIVAPGGYDETLLDVKPFDFYWQLSYVLETPRPLHAGERLLFIAHFDNSADNPRNPDATAEVRFGEQSWQEMMIGFFDVAVSPDVDKRAFFAERKTHE